MIKITVKFRETVFLSLSVFFVLTACFGCRKKDDDNVTNDNKLIKDESAEGVECSINALNFSVSGYYGNEMHRLDFNESNEIVADSSFRFTANDDKLYVSQGDTIYEVNEDELVELYRHTAQIYTMIAATDDYILFDSPVSKMVDETEKNVDEIWLYYLSAGESALLTETESAKGFYDDDELILSNHNDCQDEWFSVFTNLSGDIVETQCACIDELPKNYEIYENSNQTLYSIQKRKEDGSLKDTYLTDTEFNFEGNIEKRRIRTSQSQGNVQHTSLFNSIKVDNTTTYNIVHKFDSECNEILSWSGDVIEKYDMENLSGKIIFRENVNVLVGYDYENNIVYEINPDSCMLMSRQLGGPYPTSDIKQLKTGVKTAFFWDNHHLIYIYFGDNGPEFGGSIML